MRKANLWVAVFLFVIGAIVMFDSVRLGFRWQPGFGPGAGYLPFYLSLGVLICTGINIVKQIRQLSKSGTTGDKRLIQEGGLKPILWVLLPSTVMVILTAIIGLHFAAFVFLLFYMRAVGKIGWLECALVSVLFPIGMYVVFDRLFLIPLPDGMLGSYIKLPF
ncbi:MAG TPA: tripartite tricarboxylate transporter TctB family protein [Syntrophales bacterium]|nr:tripartite tricarboxylate transporter TctB family protein [Syntrophales bacterium]